MKKRYSSSQRNIIYSFTKTPKSSKSLINGSTKTTSDSTNEGKHPFTVGGDTVKKNVHFIMKKVMNKELSFQYSAKGKKSKKKDFSKLSVYKAVLEAVKVNFFAATDLEITRCIGVSLATAGDRDGGRQLRGWFVTIEML
ncbi:hypothetical protein NQ318_012345 [Aromia moschata]|uniref:Uncharacterized protein n=1 Tax=Aromia moschata TaxID=1265417 RepID=A0AAV8X6E2_9CUCU|nr:hypothetical protein NQ318_012345 [Aromia moschata]